MTPGHTDAAVIAEVLAKTQQEVEAKKLKAGGKSKNPPVDFALAFNKYMGAAIAKLLEPQFPGVVSGE